MILPESTVPATMFAQLRSYTKDKCSQANKIWAEVNLKSPSTSLSIIRNPNAQSKITSANNGNKTKLVTTPKASKKLEIVKPTASSPTTVSTNLDVINENVAGNLQAKHIDKGVNSYSTNTSKAVLSQVTQPVKVSTYPQSSSSSSVLQVRASSSPLMVSPSVGTTAVLDPLPSSTPQLSLANVSVLHPSPVVPPRDISISSIIPHHINNSKVNASTHSSTGSASNDSPIRLSHEVHSVRKEDPMRYCIFCCTMNHGSQVCRKYN